MNEADWMDEDDETTQERDSGLVKDLRNQNKALAKKLKELEARDEERAKADREHTVKDALKAAGFHEKAFGFVPADVTTREGVDKWLEEHGDALVPVAGTKESAPSGGQTTQVEPEVEAQMKAMQGVAATGLPPESGRVTEQDLNAAEDFQSFVALLEKGGATGL